MWKSLNPEAAKAFSTFRLSITSLCFLQNWLHLVDQNRGSPFEQQVRTCRATVVALCSLTLELGLVCQPLFYFGLFSCVVMPS